MWTPNYLTTNRSEECPRTDHALLLEHWLLVTPSRKGCTTVQALACCGPLGLTEHKSYSFSFIQNPVSTFVFGTSVQRQSFRNIHLSSSWKLLILHCLEFRQSSHSPAHPEPLLCLLWLSVNLRPLWRPLLPSKFSVTISSHTRSRIGEASSLFSLQLPDHSSSSLTPTNFQV